MNAESPAAGDPEGISEPRSDDTITDITLRNDILGPDVPDWNYLRVPIGPIEANLYYADQSAHEEPGKLILLICLLNSIESALMPHPSAALLGGDLGNDATYILVVTDLTESQTIYFAGNQNALQLVQHRLDVLSDLPEPHSRPRMSAPSSARSILLPPIAIVGETKILTTAEISQIRAKMPRRFLHRKWELLWQLSSDGCSLASMYRKLSKVEPAVLVLKTDSNEVVGAYLSDGIQNSKRYYGSGETFVFVCSPQLQSYHWQGTRANSFFISSAADGIAIGGGGTAAIWIGVDMLDGYSEPCATFGSQQLTKHSAFKIVDLEVWAIAGVYRQLIRYSSI
jgi:hypothetical protein